MAGGQAIEGARTPAFKIDVASGTLKVPGRDKVGKSSGPPELIAAHAGRLDIGKRGLWKPGFVESIAADGVKQTVTVWKDGDGVVWVVDGVQRVLGAEEALKVRKKAGDDRPILIPVLSPEGRIDDVRRFALSLSLNAHRHDDPVLVKAAKAAELYKLARGAIVNGQPQTEAGALKIVSEACGEGVGIIRDWLKLDAAPAAQKAEVQAGTLEATQVVRLQALPTDVQETTIKKLRASGPVTSDRVREAVSVHKATKGGTVSRGDVKLVPSKATARDVFRVHADLVIGEQLHPQAAAMLAWLLGTGAARDVDNLPKILEVLEGSDAAAE